MATVIDDEATVYEGMPNDDEETSSDYDDEVNPNENDGEERPSANDDAEILNETGNESMIYKKEREMSERMLHKSGRITQKKI